VRIAFVSTSYPIGDLPVDGIGNAFARIARAASRDHDVSVIVPYPEASRARILRDGAVSVHVVPMPSTTASHVLAAGRLRRLSERVRRAMAVRKQVIALDPFDVVEAPSWFGLHAFLPRRGAMRPTRVVTLLVTPLRVAVECAGARYSLGQRVADAFDRWATHRADAVVADSELHRRRMLALRWIRRSQRVSVIALPSDFRPRRPTPSDGCGTEVLQVGVLSRRKRQDVSIRSLGVLRTRMAGLRLCLVGVEIDTDGPWSRRGLSALAESCGVDVSFFAELSDAELIARYEAAAVVIQPSEYESFGLPVAEAMSCGTPVVVSAGTGASEWVTSECGSIVPTLDPARYADALEALLTDGEARAAAGVAARTIAQTAFDAAKIWRQREQLYRSLL
jgi:glycosyltransferase involved in cell wall biosynthesis